MKTLADMLAEVESTSTLSSLILASDSKQVQASIEQVQASSLILASDKASIKQARASKGGAARAACLTTERRREIAQQAVKARWAKRSKKHPIGFEFQHD